jgi:hypothetical protein
LKSLVGRSVGRTKSLHHKIIQSLNHSITQSLHHKPKVEGKLENVNLKFEKFGWAQRRSHSITNDSMKNRTEEIFARRGAIFFKK